MVSLDSVAAPANAKDNFDLTEGMRLVGMRVDRGAHGASTLEQTTFLVTTAADNGSNTAPIAGSLRAALKGKSEGGADHHISGNQFGAVPFTLNNNDAIRVTGNSDCHLSFADWQ